MKRVLIGIISLLFAGSLLAQPIIGVSSTASSGSASAPLTYINAIKNAGGVPLVIPMTTDEAQLDAILNTITGLVMTGGEDVNPHKFYGEEPHPKMGEIAPARDEFDYILIKKAVEKGIPVLGICRGMQMLNVALGGTLIQDIPSQVKGSMVDHKQEAPSSTATHSITIQKGSLLYNLLKTEKTAVNTFHHQAVKRVAPSLKVIAVAKDGVVEAIEGTGNMRVLGLQFHPEGFAAHGQCEFSPIFEWLVNEAKVSPAAL
jgi:putative glutamine amidotransferase